MKKFDIMIGLPGSGKTFFTQKEFGNRRDTKVFSMDNGRINGIEKNYSHELKYRLINPYEKIFNYNIVIDAPIFSLKDLSSVINVIWEAREYKKINEKINLTFHFWEENREQCLINDKIRIESGVRNLISNNTIKTTPYITESELQCVVSELTSHSEISSAKIRKHYVYSPSDEDFNALNLIRFYPNKKIEKGELFLFSETWSGGGVAGNCWGDEMTPISAEEPLEFNEFDELMTSLSPKLYFLDYQKIRKETVYLIRNTESEYYGGYSDYCTWACNVSKLFDVVKEYGYKFPDCKREELLCED